MLGKRNINCISCGEGANAQNIPVKHVTGKDGVLYRTDIDAEAMDRKKMRSKSPKIKKNRADMATYYAIDKDGVERKKKMHGRLHSLITEDDAKKELDDLTKDIKEAKTNSQKGASIMKVLSKRASTNTTSMANMRDS